MRSLIGITLIFVLLACYNASLNFRFLKNYDFARPPIQVGHNRLVEGKQVPHWEIDGIGILSCWKVDKKQGRRIQAMLFALDYSITQRFMSEVKRTEASLVITYSKSDCEFEGGTVQFLLNEELVFQLGANKVQMTRNQSHVYSRPVSLRMGQNVFEMMGSGFQGQNFCGFAVLSTNIFQPFAVYKKTKAKQA